MLIAVNAADDVYGRPMAQARGHVSRDVLAVEESMEVWASVFNTELSDLSNLCVNLVAKGFAVLSRPDWPKELSKNANLTGAYVLKATETGTHTISLVIFYQIRLSGEEARQHTLVVKIGDVTVRSPYYPVPEWVTGSVALLFSSWLVQLTALLGIGSLFADRLKIRFSAKEKEKETYAQSLAAIKELTFQYIIPAAGTARAAASSLQAALADPTYKAAPPALYMIADFISRTLLWTKEAGGVYRLREYEAERIAVRLQGKLWDALPFRTVDHILLTEYATSKEGKPLAFGGYARFMQDLEKPDTELSRLYSSFKTWLATSKEEAARLIDLMACWGEYAMYEVNRVLVPWCGREPPSPSSRCTEIISELRLELAESSRRT